MNQTSHPFLSNHVHTPAVLHGRDGANLVSRSLCCPCERYVCICSTQLTGRYIHLAERWGTWSHPKRARKQIPTFAQRTPSSSQREPASSSLRRVFEPPSTAAASSKPPPLRESQQQRQNKSASAPRPRTARAPIPHFRTYSHTQSSAAKSKAAVAPEPEDEDALAIARIHAWLDKVDDEHIAAEVEAERRAKARRVCEERPAEQPTKPAEAEAVQNAPGVGDVEVDVEADVEVPSKSQHHHIYTLQLQLQHYISTSTFICIE